MVLCYVTELSRISLNNMLGVYIVLGVGVLVAFFTMIGEILWNRKQKGKLETVSETNREPEVGELKIEMACTCSFRV